MFDHRSKFGLPIHSWLSFNDTMVGLLLSSFVINCLGLVFPVCVLQFYDRVIPNKSIGTLTAIICLVLGALLLEGILKILRAYVSSWSSARFTYNMGKLLFHRLLYADYSVYERGTAGAYLDRYSSAESLRDYYCGQNLILLVDLPFIFVYTLLMFMISSYVALVPIFVIVLMFITSSSAGESNYKNMQSKKQVSEVKSKFLIEMITGIHTIKSLGMEEQFLRRYERLHQKEITSNYDLIQSSSQSSRQGNFYSQLAVILTVSVGGLMVVNHSLTVGGLAASILLTGKLMLPVTKAIEYLERIKNVDIAKQDLNFILNMPLAYNPDLPEVTSFTGEIAIENVSFKYPGTDKVILQNANLKINSKDTIVLHGASGVGKSTTMSLICGLYKVDSGMVLANGTNITELNEDSYRRQVAFLNDCGELFQGTILDNITMFEPEKYEAEAKQIAKEIGLHDIIDKMPNAYHTEVGMGVVDLLSKGHKQQIMIVRALLGNPKLILFDEANLSLDIDSDIKLRKYLMSKKGECSMVLITHRPSLLEMADKHYKIENCSIVETKWP